MTPTPEQATAYRDACALYAAAITGDEQAAQALAGDDDLTRATVIIGLALIDAVTRSLNATIDQQRLLDAVRATAAMHAATAAFP